MIDGTQSNAELLNPDNEDGDVEVTLTLNARELIALMVTVNQAQDADKEVETAAALWAGYGEKYARGYIVAFGGATLAITRAMSALTGNTEALDKIAGTTAKLDQFEAKWREAA